MRTDPRTRRAPVLAFALVFAAGCGSNATDPLDLRGREMSARLPQSIRGLVPEATVLCFEEQGEGGSYSLFLLRNPGGDWLPAPKKKPAGWEQHRMPATALEGLIATKLPSLTTGKPKEPRCLLTHWRDADGAEIQVRELVTEQGWFASVERVVP